MSEITLHTGNQGDHIGINIDWFDENNIRHQERLVIMIDKQDKPRAMKISINGHVVARIFPGKMFHLLEPWVEVKS